ncbi:hypothetical protein OKW30_000773 [Paraburkholderia sp. Clong3]|uniref:hypothetical protein n=1 Tax=Paraburkholderia sp. Clong3 TaxID=2991061 RepID=UPI003D1B2A66
MKIYTRIGIALFSCALVGCASIQPKALAPEQGEALRGTTLVVDEYQRPTFAATTPGKAMFGMIGAALMIAEGKRFVTESEIHDPAAHIGNQVAQRIASQHGITLRSIDAAPLDSNAIDAIVARYPESDLVLDSQTTYWSYVYFPTHWDSYRLMYVVRLRLIDTHSRSVLAEAVCKRIPEYLDDAPSHDRLIANSGEWVKQRLMIYADSCVDELASTILGVATATAQAAEDHAEKESTAALK